MAPSASPLLATVSTSHTESLLAQGTSQPSALTSGYHLAFGVGATLVATAIVVTAAAIRPAAGQHLDADISATVAEPANVL